MIRWFYHIWRTAVFNLLVSKTRKRYSWSCTLSKNWLCQLIRMPLAICFYCQWFSQALKEWPRIFKRRGSIGRQISDYPITPVDRYTGLQKKSISLHLTMSNDITSENTYKACICLAYLWLVHNMNRIKWWIPLRITKPIPIFDIDNILILVSIFVQFPRSKERVHFLSRW